MTTSEFGLPAPVRSFTADGFTLTERRHPRDCVVSGHEHVLPIIGVVLEGHFIESQGRHSYEHAPHGLQILPAGERHAYRFGHHQVHCVTVEVTSQKLERIRRFSDVLDRPSHVGGPSLRGAVRRLYREFRGGDDACALTVEGLVLEILGAATLTRRYPSARPPKWLQEVRDFLHAHASEKVSVTDLASWVDVHPAHLMRAFRRHYGSSIGDYVRRLRLNHALDHLATSMTLAQVATAAGFYDQSHFSRCFMLETGMTPAEYRASIRGKHC
jgi:AraC family transcriptional regulator